MILSINTRVSKNSGIRVHSSKNERMGWFDLIKAFALVWIITNHITEQLFGFPLIANPMVGWPPLAERISQLAPLRGLGVWSIPANALRYFGWFGDRGVQLFLIASGFGLTWCLLQNPPASPFPLWRFYLQRAKRIYPLWWRAHIFFCCYMVGNQLGIPLTGYSFYPSLLGIRITPGLLYYFSPAWWYFRSVGTGLSYLSFTMAGSSAARTRPSASDLLCQRLPAAWDWCIYFR